MLIAEVTAEGPGTEKTNKFSPEAAYEYGMFLYLEKRDYKSGLKGAINFLVGAVMKYSNKRADFKLAKELLEEELK